MEGFDELKGDSSPLQPVYPSTEKLKARSLGGRQIAKLTRQLLSQLREKDIPEFIPEEIRRKTGLISRFQAEQSNTWKQQKRDALPVEIEEFFSTS